MRYFGSGSAPACNAQNSARANYNPANGNPTYCNWTDQLYSYDVMGRLTSVPTATPSEAGWSGHGMTMTYDLAGNMTSLGYPDGRSITIGTDAANHLQSLTGNGYNYLASATYWPDGSPQSMTLGNGATQTFNKNNRLQPASITAQINANGLNATVFNRGYSYTSSCQSANTGNITAIADQLNGNNSQHFCYDNLHRLSSFVNGNSTMQQSFSYDSFGNLSQSGTVSSQPLFDVNNRISSGGYTYDNAGNVKQFSNAGVTSNYVYDGANRLYQVNPVTGANPGGNYTYDANGERMRKDLSDGSYTEYQYLNGRVVAEKHSDGTWTDYLYANGQMLAKLDGETASIHVHGNDCSTCQSGWVNTYFSSPIVGYQIQSGDQLMLLQNQVNIQGGFQLNTQQGGSTWPSVTDQYGDILNQSTAPSGVWRARRVDLSQFAGQTVSNVTATITTAPPANTVWDIYYRDIVIVSTDGTVHPVYTGTMQPSFSQSGAEGEADLRASVDTIGNSLGDPSAGHSYLGDHLGTARLELSSGGWPVSSFTYYPFGQEPQAVSTTNNYKFTGLERDAESGLDHATFRTYSSMQGRWMSPDPYAGSYDASDPQSLNRYSYAMNVPLSETDPTGLETAVYQVGDCTVVTWDSDYIDSNGVDQVTNTTETFGCGGGVGAGGPGGSTIASVPLPTPPPPAPSSNCIAVNGKTVCPSPIDNKYSLDNAGQRDYRENKPGCNLHVAVDKQTGQINNPHMDEYNPNYQLFIHLFLDWLPDKIYDLTGHYPIPAGRTFCQ